MERRLAAIMFTDIVGYTTMMGENEKSALEKVARHREVLNDCTDKYGGEVLQFYGDGSLSTYPSAIAAVQCAVEIQQEYKSGVQVPVRIGIHIGDIVRKDDAIFGNGVNIASRIEGVGVPGCVLYSWEVYDKLRNQSEIRSTSLGTFEFKNVVNPIEVFAIEKEGYPIPQYGEMGGKTVRHTPDKSIAVLPFDNMSADTGQDFFSDGITEEIINALVQLPGLKVTGRTSTFSFKGQHKDLREVAQQLNVRTVLEGSVRTAGNRIRVTAQLVKAEDGFHMWSERYDRDMEDVFAIQDEIASSIAEKLKVTLLGEEQQTLVKKATDNLEAYRLYLQGRAFLDKRSEGVINAISCFEKALVLDPDYALAHAGLGYAYIYLRYFGYAGSVETMDKVRKSAMRALELDPDLPVAHHVLGLVYLYSDRNFLEAERLYERALSLSPNSYDAYRVIAYYHSATSQHEKAIANAQKAVVLDPLNVNAQISLAEIYYRARRGDDALKTAVVAKQIEPHMSEIYNVIGKVHLLEGRNQEALEAFQSALDTFGETGSLLLGYILSMIRLGNFDQIQERLVQILKEGKYATFPHIFAVIYFELKQFQKALKYLEAGEVYGDPFIVLLLVEPLFDKARGNSRFDNFIKGMNFPNYSSLE